MGADEWAEDQLNKPEPLTWKNELDGFAIAFQNTERGRDGDGKVKVEHGAIRLGPRMIQAGEMPYPLQEEIHRYLTFFLEAEEKAASRSEALDVAGANFSSF
jgi:hypothetical protein